MALPSRKADVTKMLYCISARQGAMSGAWSVVSRSLRRVVPSHGCRSRPGLVWAGAESSKVTGTRGLALKGSK